MTTTELTQKQITSNVANRIEAMKGEGLLIAPNYSVSNALSSAYYALKNSNGVNLLQQCSQDSVYNALLEMVTQGLSPAKKQCYFIKYGNDVQLRMSYFGTIKVIKDLQDVKDVIANVVNEGDVLEVSVENGRKKLVKHETHWQNADNPIIAAYCIITRTDGEEFFEVMTKKQIDKSWSKAKTKNVQIDFPDQMAMRTVINRAAKMFINTSNDSDLFAGAINKTIADEYNNERQMKEAEPVQSAGQDILDKMTEKTVAEEPAEDATISEVETVEEAGVDISKMETTEQVIDAETGEILDEEEPF
ncbi:TPA: recombinase RecT [Streptococcus suis]|nr:recombinase RecT [Streptococcus suis]